MQYSTQHYGRRPYGVGMLIAGCDVSNLFTLIIGDSWYCIIFPCRAKALISTKLVHHPTIMTVRPWLLGPDHR